MAVRTVWRSLTPASPCPLRPGSLAHIGAHWRTLALIPESAFSGRNSTQTPSGPQATPRRIHQPELLEEGHVTPYTPSWRSGSERCHDLPQGKAAARTQYVQNGLLLLGQIMPDALRWYIAVRPKAPVRPRVEQPGMMHSPTQATAGGVL